LFGINHDCGICNEYEVNTSYGVCKHYPTEILLKYEILREILKEKVTDEL